MNPRWLRAGLPLLIALAAAPSGAQSRPGETPLADILQVLVVDRELLAIDAAGGGQTVARLRLDETVHWKGSRGQVGVVLTDQRMLAATTESSFWQEIAYRRTETRPEEAVLGERVALVVTSERILGLDGKTGNLVEYDLGVRERVIYVRAGESVGVVVTDRQALGLSPFVGGFFSTPIKLSDTIESIAVDANLATLISSHRLLTFRATTGTWEERSRTLR